tara:strand:+ start:2137 stop:2379 length:243 start_codon:yes stop_codon:yes gene_type:complete
MTKMAIANVASTTPDQRALGTPVLTGIFVAIHAANNHGHISFVHSAIAIIIDAITSLARHRHIFVNTPVAIIVPLITDLA